MALREQDQLINNYVVHSYFFAGDYPADLVLVHGLGVSSRYMLPLAEQLGKRHNVYALDLPGFGKSAQPAETGLELYGDTIAAFIKANKLTHPVLVANSFGCQVSLTAIKKYPQLARGAVLIGPTMNKYERRAGLQIIRWLQNLANEPTKKMAWILLKDIAACGLIKVFRTLRIGLKDRPELGLEAITMPILFMRGGLDPIAPRKWIEYLVRHNPRFSFKELPEAGHALNFNSPEPLAVLIDDYVNSLSGK